MRYAMLLKPHANARYRQSLQKLAQIELQAILGAWDFGHVAVAVEEIANEPFLTFECDPLPEAVWQAVSRHSAICLAAERREEGTLVPLARRQEQMLPEDLPHVLKYKGKTNADFTYMMLHCAQAASAFARTEEKLCVLDPMCGKATTLFCALCEGNDAIGIEPDAKALQEAATYYERFLKLHRIKHKREEGSRTLKRGGSVRCTVFDAAQNAQALKADQRLHLELLSGDATRAPEMLRAGSCHLVVSDLPYGIQHAPKEDGGMSSLRRLLDKTAPGCVHALKPGGAAAFSFNENTLRRKEVEEALSRAGLEVMQEPPYADFSHWVEQAVERDVVIARKPVK